jgi:hypothetical protein
MNTTLVRRIIGLLLAALLLTGILLLAGGTAAAQGRRIERKPIIVRPIRPFPRYDPFRSPYGRFNRHDYYNQYVFSNSESAYHQGYKDGLNTGSEDGKKAKTYDPERSHYFQDAGFGNFGEVYREGFTAGYRDGYRQQGVG